MSQRAERTLRDANRAVMTELLLRLGSQDFSGACSLLSEDVLCDWPFPPMSTMPSAIRGRGEMEAFLSQGMSAFDPYRYEITDVFELLEPTRLIAEYQSNSRYIPSGAPYRNHYLGIFEFKDGLVCYWREYINPVVISEVLATADQG
ncbi:MAG: hypothetical protein CL933_03485 [Deltaproteobacteria bacterium]|nr:hypothetical protein [Deltaproteobacteria bacterium]